MFQAEGGVCSKALGLIVWSISENKGRKVWADGGAGGGWLALCVTG